MSVTGDTIMRETVWQGTAAFDMEGFWSKGEHRSLEVLSVMTFSGQQLVGWSDYG